MHLYHTNSGLLQNDIQPAAYTSHAYQLDVDLIRFEFWEWRDVKSQEFNIMIIIICQYDHYNELENNGQLTDSEAEILS